MKGHRINGLNDGLRRKLKGTHIYNITKYMCQLSFLHAHHSLKSFSLSLHRLVDLLSKTSFYFPLFFYLFPVFFKGKEEERRRKRKRKKNRQVTSPSFFFFLAVFTSIIYIFTLDNEIINGQFL